MGCTTSIVKYLLFVFNCIFVIAGLTLLTVGVLFKLNVEEFTNYVNKRDESFSLAPTLLIVVGGIIFIIAFFGCCGAIKESSCMLTTYAVILLVLFIAQISLGVFAFLQFGDDKNDVRNSITNELEHTFDKYHTDKAAKEFVDSMQYELKCCGVVGSEYWHSNLPPTCCPNKPQYCSQADAYHQGCANSLWEFIKKTVKMIGYVCVGIGVTEIVGSIIGFCLASHIRNNERRGHFA